MWNRDLKKKKSAPSRISFEENFLEKKELKVVNVIQCSYFFNIIKFILYPNSVPPTPAWSHAC